MNEQFLHYIWRHGLFCKTALADTGETIEVLSPGSHNTDAGPDFLNARIKIDGTIWAGNVEIHTDPANWEKHKHCDNPAYNSVILHVASKNGKKAVNLLSRVIPTIVLDFDISLLNKYRQLMGAEKPLPCQHDLKEIDSIKVSMWLESLIVERIEEKTGYIASLLEVTNSNWEEAFYISLARNFGFKTNALPFEILAKSVPLKLLSKYKTNIVQLEALLFGQAGFLSGDMGDEYFRLLKKEYGYLQKAHKLKPMEMHLWKFLRLRPVNFPTIRIAQFASLVNQSLHLFSKTMGAENARELMELFNCSVSGYWASHYTFGAMSAGTKKSVGKTSLYGILINTVIPFLFLYGKLRGQPGLQEKALSLLEQIPAENNHVVKNWAGAGIKPENALQSQGLLQLTGNYCLPKNCLYCQIGNEILRRQLL